MGAPHVAPSCRVHAPCCRQVVSATTLKRATTIRHTVAVHPLCCCGGHQGDNHTRSCMVACAGDGCRIVGFVLW